MSDADSVEGMSRDEMVREGWSRKNVNRQLGRVRAMFRWGAGQALIEHGIYHRLKTVEV